MSHSVKKHPVKLSLGLMAWNEEDSLLATLESLFRQSVFERLCTRHAQCEIVVVVTHACTDRIGALVRSFFKRMERAHSWSDGFTARVIDIPEPGRTNVWNRFVHEFSAVEARFIVSVGERIVFPHRDTVYNLMAALERRPHVAVSTGRRGDDLVFKESPTLRERLARSISPLAEEGSRCLYGRLYCLRACVARNLFLPRDLGPNEAGFIAEMACTEFLSRGEDARRFVVAPEAARVFELADRPRDVGDERKREMVQQTTVHVLVEFVRSLSRQSRIHLADTLRRQDADDPDWLNRLIAAHLRRNPFFWQIVPGAPTAVFKRLRQKARLARIAHFPAACAGFLTTLMACAGASRTLRRRMVPYRSTPDRAAAVTVAQSME